MHLLKARDVLQPDKLLSMCSNKHPIQPRQAALYLCKIALGQMIYTLMYMFRTDSKTVAAQS